MAVILDGMMRKRALIVLGVVFLMAIAVAEHDLRATIFVVAIAALLTASLSLLTRRPRFSVYATGMLLAVLTAVSAAKMKYMGVALHAFDAFFYLRDASVAEFLLGSFLAPILAVVAVLVGAVVVLTLVWRREAPSATIRRPTALALPILLVAPGLAFPRSPEDVLDSYYFRYHLTSSVFASLPDVESLTREPDLVRHLASIDEPGAYTGATRCSGAENGPDIVVALMESAVPPALYPDLRHAAELDRAFLGDDGRERGLRVETFGGGTWITTTGLFAGLPTTEFGWMRPYLPYYLEGRIHHSVPRALERCGYDTAVVSPLAYRFVDEGPFLTSIGFDAFYDWKEIGAATKQERDRVYFDAVLARLRAHRAATDRPLMIFVMTMATHSPFDRRFAPEEVLPDEPWGNDPQTDEYLRRLMLQRRDLDDFAAALAREPGRNGTILADFGDHQPVVTRERARAADPKALENLASVAFRTYWRITGIGRPLARALPEVDVLDVPYLGVTILEAAGLPLDDVHTELAALRDACAGRFADCRDRTRVDRHLKKFANARMLDLGDGRPAADTRTAAAGQ